MTERVSIRRRLTTTGGVVVSVTVSDPSTSVQWQERVLAPTPGKIKAAVRACRRQCLMLLEGIDSG